MPEPLNQQIDRLRELYLSEMDPTGRAFVPLADTHRRSGELDRALEVLQEGLAVHPDFASAHVVGGWLHWDRHEGANAIRSFERVLELDAENRVALRALAESVEDARQRLAYVDRLAELEPDDPELAAVRESLEAEVAAGPARGGAEATETPASPVVSVGPAAAAKLQAGEAGEPVVAEALPAPVAIAALAPDVPQKPVPISKLAPDAPEAAEVPAQAKALIEQPSAEGAVEQPSVEDDPPAAVVLDEPEVEAGEEICTQTLGELYAKQGAVDRAVEIYRKLLVDDPVNTIYLHRVAELTNGIDLGPSPVAGRPVAPLEPAEPAPDRPVVPIESLAPNPALVTDEAPETPPSDLRPVLYFEYIEPLARDPAGAVELESDVVPIAELAPGPAAVEMEPPSEPGPLSAVVTEEARDAARDDRPVVTIESLAPDGPAHEEADDPFPWLNEL